MCSRAVDAEAPRLSGRFSRRLHRKGCRKTDMRVAGKQADGIMLSSLLFIRRTHLHWLRCFFRDVQHFVVQIHGLVFAFLGHLLRDDLINPVKNIRSSVRTYVRTSTTKLNAATNQIVVFVRIDETFTTI